MTGDGGARLEAGAADRHFGKFVWMVDLDLVLLFGIILVFVVLLMPAGLLPTAER